MRRLIFLVAISLLAQDTTFKVNTNLVMLNVTVKDKSGKPLTTLKKEDVEVYEDGVKQTLAVFEMQTLNSDLLPPMDIAATDSGNAPKTIEEKAAAPVPNPTTPPAVQAPTAIRHQDRRLLALFFDLSSMQPFEQIRAVDSAIKFLATQMTKSDLVEIMTFGSRFQVVQEFTDDRDVLTKVLRKISIGEGSDLAGLASTSADENDDTGTFSADNTEFNVFNTDMKLSALEDACTKLAAFPEKKALVYFSSGVSKTGVENQAQLKATVNAAVRANLSFYPVDARGLVATAPGGDASVASPKGTGMFTGSAQASLKSTFNDSQETLYTLAADTGGKALLDSNDLGVGIRQAEQDIGTYYIVGYYSRNEAADGKFRHVEVKLVNKSLQAKIASKRGYYASKSWGKMSSADKERQLEEALTLGDPVSELPLALEVDYFRVARERYFVPISVKIPGSVLALAKKGGQQITDFDFIGQVRDATGKLVGGVRDNITVKLTDANAERLGNRNLQYDAGLTLSPGNYSLRFLARENQTGKMGTFESKFTVPDLNTGRNLRVSSVILSSQKEAVAAAVGSADNNKKLLAGHPLVDNGQKTVPSITRVFRKDQTLYVYFEVYDPTPDENAKTPRLTAEIDLLQGARKAFTSPPMRVNKLGTTRPGVAPFSFQIPLARMAAGQYVSQVNVIDENGRRFAFPRSSMVVLP